MKTIEVLSTFFAAGQKFHAGEIRKVEPEQAGHYCACGWAKDLSGELATGAPDTTPKTVTVTNAATIHAAEEA